MEENNEQKTDEKGKSEVTTPAENAGVQSETIRTVDDINLAAKRAEEAAEKLRIENDRKEYNYAKMQRGGVTEAGQQQQKPPEISDEEYSKKARQGEFNKSHKFKQ